MSLTSLSMISYNSLFVGASSSSLSFFDFFFGPFARSIADDDDLLTR